MSLLTRLLQRIDDRLDITIDRHLQLALPQQRSVSPDEVIRRHLAPARVEHVGSWPCCPCLPPGCVEVHRDPCDLHHAGEFG